MSVLALASRALPSERRRSGRSRFVVAALFAVVALAAQLLSTSTASAFPDGDFRGTRVTGHAWGAEARLNHLLLPDLSLGKVAAQSLACRPPDTSFNTVASAGIPADHSLVSLGVVENRGVSEVDPSFAEVRESSTVADVSLLQNFIRAKAVSAHARSHYDSDGRTDTGNVEFVDLKVGTLDIGLTVQPNSEILLPGLRVVLNEQKFVGKKFVVNGIHVYVNGFLGYTGEITVAHADTSLARGNGQLSGYAYLSTLRLKTGGPVDPLLKAISGRQNVVNLPCRGGENESIAVGVGLEVGSDEILTSATSTSTVNGDIDQAGAFSTSSHTLEGVSLLNGRITADLLAVEAHTETTENGVESNATTSVANLVIDGVLYADVDAELEVNLPGIGFVRINETKCVDDQTDKTPCVGEHYNAITVYSIHVVVNTLNPILPVKAELIVGAAHSDVNF